VIEKVKKIEDTKFIENVISKISVQILRMMENKFKPGKNKEHYIFTMKDIMRVYKGIFSIDMKIQVGNDQFMKVLFNECNRVFLDRLTSSNDIKS